MFLGLWMLTNLFRSPAECDALGKFFVNCDSKAHVLENFRCGFASQFEYKPPVAWGHVNNYPPLLDNVGRGKFRREMHKQIIAGKMIGGPG